MGSPRSTRRAEVADTFGTSSWRKKELVYQLLIVCGVIWNLRLMRQHAASMSDLTGTGEDKPHTTFILPESYTDTQGSAGVVCSGCSDQDGNTPESLKAAAAAAAAAALANLTNATAIKTEAPPPSLSPPPPASASPPPPASVLNAIPTVSKLEEGASCTSSFKGDSTSAKCFPFCQAKYAKFHCERCKCRSCAFCALPSPPPSPAVLNTTEEIHATAALDAAAATTWQTLLHLQPTLMSASCINKSPVLATTNATSALASNVMAASSNVTSTTVTTTAASSLVAGTTAATATTLEAAASLAAVSTAEKAQQPEPEVAEDTEEIVMEEKPIATTPEEDTPEAAMQREKEETGPMDTSVIGA